VTCEPKALAVATLASPQKKTRRKSLLVESKQQSQPRKSDLKTSVKPTPSAPVETRLESQASVNQEEEQPTAQTLQASACFDQSQALGANFCRECSSPNKEKLERDDCRFVGWRKINLASNKSNAFLTEIDVKQEDVDLWLPREDINKSIRPSSNVTDKNKFIRILGDIRESFVKIWNEESEAMRRVRDPANEGNVCWKRLLEQTREACDQCKTHIFNVHYSCRKCGFAVCLSCYDHRMKDKNPIGNLFN